ncbi:anthocyanidin 3-O-glucosyltransferase 5-like [Dorcoceras hygrometricum]|uniref:Glycosyltransferase n=1 Tax=Dorcoceras hygrometricum TaxID=472368 RepID=A0A2Z7ACI0_9LAMI|nr:anthocyanidin 3-O-glucosyltransferase 5-like [Dorcoceras hygrometricum]
MGELSMDDSSSRKLHVIILSSPGAGHLIPVVILANHLAAEHGVRSTVLQVRIAESPESNLLVPAGDRELVEIVQLPPVDITNLVDPDTKVVTQLCMMMREAVPLVRSAVAAMDRRPDALIVDLFGSESLPIAGDLRIPKYVYCTSTAWFLALTVYSPILDGEIEGQYVDQPGHLEIPGCKLVRPEDVADPMLDRGDQQYREYVRMGKEFALSDGILVNTFEDLEPKTLQAFRENEAMKSVLKPPVYPIGPLTRPVQLTQTAGLKSDVMDWLDKQPNQSVLFVSFGSGGLLSIQQTTELALGLELSQQRFLWVIRSPTQGGVDEAFFTGKGGAEDDYLPKGFLDRTKDIGRLVLKWAQQVEVLAHPSVGGFLSHCGWNSSLESITSGVPMIAWPLYAEQRLNAAMLVEELGVAVRPEVLPTKKVVGREEVAKMVRTLIEHKDAQAMRDRAKQLTIIATNGLKEGGSSSKSICKILLNIEAKEN